MKLLVAVAITALPWVCWKLSPYACALVLEGSLQADRDQFDVMDRFIGCVFVLVATGITLFIISALVSVWGWAL